MTDPNDWRDIIYDPPKAEQAKAVLLNHRGASDAITSGELADEINLPDGEANPQARGLVRDLVLEEGVPVAAHEQGYFLIQRDRELYDYLDALDQRIEAIKERREAVIHAYLDWYEADLGSDAPTVDGGNL
jgi:hypothetical protein